MPVKKCEVCGLEFKARLNRIRTCSTQCRNTLISKEKSLRHQAVKHCVVCNAEFQVGAVDAERQTCSKECSYKLRGSKTSLQQEMTCVTCGTGFFTQLSQIKAGGGLYCSDKCMYERNKQQTTRACECCGKLFSTPPSQMWVRTCSRECSDKWFMGERRAGYLGATIRTLNPDGTSSTKEATWYSRKRVAAKRIAITQATPVWADMESIKNVYLLAVKLEAETGVKYHVDHIVPINGRTVSGLHNEFNLQAIPALDNLKKSNRTWPDKP